MMNTVSIDNLDTSILFLHHTYQLHLCCTSMGKVNVRLVSGARMWAMVDAETVVKCLAALSKYISTHS